MRIKVTISEMQDAARKVAQECENYRNAAANMNSAADALGATWEGEAHDKFVSSMQQRKQWYDKMSDIVDQYVQQLNTIAANYEDMDQQMKAAVTRQ